MIATHDCGGLNNLINVHQVQGRRDNSRLFLNVVFSQFSTLIAAWQLDSSLHKSKLGSHKINGSYGCQHILH